MKYYSKAPLFSTIKYFSKQKGEKNYLPIIIYSKKNSIPFNELSILMS